MKTITKKAYTEYFDLVLSGKKTFDLRVADFDCEPGDILELVEIDMNKVPTSRVLRKKVGVVGQINNMESMYPTEDIEKYGLQIISLLDEEVA